MRRHHAHFARLQSQEPGSASVDLGAGLYLPNISDDKTQSQGNPPNFAMLTSRPTPPFDNVDTM